MKIKKLKFEVSLGSEELVPLIVPYNIKYASVQNVQCVHLVTYGVRGGNYVYIVNQKIVTNFIKKQKKWKLLNI